MTVKKITLAEERKLKIEPSTVLKKGNDLFIVAEIEREGFINPIETALFEDASAPPYYETRKRVEGKYALISFTTGKNFFSQLYTLYELRHKINGRDFEIVNEIEFREV